MDESQLLLKERELVRLRVVETTLSGRSARDAAEMLQLSVRQVFRSKPVCVLREPAGSSMATVAADPPTPNPSICANGS